MKEVKLKLIIILTALVVLSSCSESEQGPDGKFTNGVFVINEGNFSEANGTISFYRESSREVSQDIFDQANGFSPGGLLQSVYFHENRAFIIDNSGSKIYVVDADSFELIQTIEDGLSAPRYMTVLDDRAYVTNWGPYDENFSLNESYVLVINLETYDELSSIPTDSGCEGIMAYGGRVAVANSFSNTVDIIDPASASVVTQLVVAAGPTSFVEDINGKTWLLSNSWLTGSALSQLDLLTEEVIKSFTIGGSAKSLQTNPAKDQLYYLSAPFDADASVYKVSIDATEDNSEAVVSAPNLYGMGIHPVTGEIYLANHNGFQGNGTGLIYNADQLKSTFATGVGPNGFVFR